MPWAACTQRLTFRTWSELGSRKLERASPEKAQTTFTTHSSPSAAMLRAQNKRVNIALHWKGNLTIAILGLEPKWLRIA
eukprot:11187788-Heterocapsa_arctica.AAC.1